ncbi:MAG: CDP-alcohol phosphatidyltransferase family protein [Planctomycetaceae bacterium]|nr:CDP-alcohol phosphatidyltransferase family protein [Planctomycetaceae bacterium]
MNDSGRMNSETTETTERVPGPGQPSPVTPRGPYQDRIVTIPNIICAVRLAGSLALFGFALTNNAGLFAGLFTLLSLSDWIDGKLARWLNQRSDFGARLDSFADSVLYAALFFGLFWLRWEVLRAEGVWWIVAFLSYLLTTFYGLWKFGKVPSYHTYGAKTSQWLVLTGAVTMLLDYSTWPFRIAMIGVTLTNLEATAMTWYLKEWRADVLTILHLLPKHDGPSNQNPELRN